MSTAALTPAAGPVSPATAAGVDERGRTSLADRVVEKTAARAALEVDHVHGVSRGSPLRCSTPTPLSR